MSHAIDRLRSPATTRGIASALMILSLGFALPCAAAEDSPQLRLAQAAPPPGQKAAPQRQTQPAQPPVNPVDRQIADLQKRLAITPAQQPQFDGFAQAVRQNAAAMDTLGQQEQQKTNQNAVEELRSSVAFAQAEADGLKRLLPALEALYGSLSDQQKRTADQVFSNAPAPKEPAPRKKG